MTGEPAWPLTPAANALTRLLGGILVLAAPFALGFLADHVGLAVG
ncbi:hypothetical protein U2F26_22385 [Micromonospora sp. 4G57]|uniref:MFS transporter n=1 Tax=Micromonospora sicca TaxID=2202420 RepID=A0ABU5JFB6_9ACTN|nr:MULTISPECIES: hypothetical protein [unclassified Micromonospora]MDZ5445444.1 hypothetical protein [Micromonospora sp. 4G57]MDZ5491147.1 hypothetical protein [Micromonospora sp. 4G53]